MSKDISYAFTKNEGKKNGSTWAKIERIRNISPSKYGSFLQKRRKSK